MALSAPITQSCVRKLVGIAFSTQIRTCETYQKTSHESDWDAELEYLGPRAKAVTLDVYPKLASGRLEVHS